MKDHLFGMKVCALFNYHFELCIRIILIILTIEFYLNLQGSGENIIFELWDEDSARTDDLLAQLVVPISSIESRKSKKKKKKESGEKTVTEKLVGPDGSEAGEFTYSMRFLLLFIISKVKD